MRHCPICKKLEKRVIKHIKMVVPEDFILPTEYDIVVCNNCGFVFNDVAYSKCFDEYYGNYKENTYFNIPSEIDYVLHHVSGEEKMSPGKIST